MRTTLSLDDDVVSFARDYAHRRRLTIGEAISELAREGIRSGARRATLPKPTSRFALIGARNEQITSEHVRDLMDAEGI
jgi:hypothetical protein